MHPPSGSPVIGDDYWTELLSGRNGGTFGTPSVGRGWSSSGRRRMFVRRSLALLGLGSSMAGLRNLSLSLTASLRVQLPLAPPSALRSRGFLQGSLGRWCMRFCEVMDRAYSPLSPSSWPLRPFTFRLDATSCCVLPGP